MQDQGYDLDTPLLDLSSNITENYWTIRDAVEGLQIFGGIGSGKTSGSGRMVALKFLAHGFGGLVLTAKHDEKELWQRYCEETNRSKDLIIVEPLGANFFNFLEYESGSAEDGKSLTLNIVQLLKTVIRARDTRSIGKADDKFWETALDMLLANLIDLCQLAYGKVTLQHLYEIAQSAPSEKLDKKAKEQAAKAKEASPDQGNDNAKDKQKEKSKGAAQKSPFDRAFSLAMKRIENKIRSWRNDQDVEMLHKMLNPTFRDETFAEVIAGFREMEFVHDFFFETYKNLAEKTRSIVDFSLLGFLHGLLQEPTYSLFCKHKSNFTPEDSLKGKIILLSLPVKVYQNIGQDCQVMFKYIWQRAMERRKINKYSKPVFLWADEAQNFLHEHDADYQATARSSMIATVYISQNLPNYYANMGGEQGQYKVKSFLGTLSTKIFHANSDLETNKYASDLCGQGYRKKESEGVTGGKEFSFSKNQSMELEQVVRPEQFSWLKTGGKLNDFKVQGYLIAQGKNFGNDFNFKRIRFNQKYNPNDNEHSAT